MIQERMIIQRRLPGFPYANRLKRRTHADHTENYNFLDAKLRRKNGIVRINSVSEICETDMMIAGYFTANKSLKAECS